MFTCQYVAKNPRHGTSGDKIFSQAALEENFPLNSNSAWTFFTNPLTSIERMESKLLTLAEVSDLFETFYSSLHKYSLKLNEEDTKKVFLKILEDVKETDVDVTNDKILSIFLQIRIATYSRSV